MTGQSAETRLRQAPVWRGLDGLLRLTLPALLVLAIASCARPYPGVKATPSQGATPAPAASQLLAEMPAPMIRRAQRLLTELGYEPGPPDGIVGQRTREAVTDFQTAKGLPPDGRVSYKLILELDRARDAAVIAEAQERLARLGYDPGPVDGRLGQRTLEAIESFQRSQGLPATGQVTPRLLDRLAAAEGQPPQSSTVAERRPPRDEAREPVALSEPPDSEAAADADAAVAQIVDLPESELAASESETVDLPATETPAVEAPEAEAPALEAPATDASPIEAPVVESPEADSRPLQEAFTRHEAEPAQTAALPPPDPEVLDDAVTLEAIEETPDVAEPAARTTAESEATADSEPDRVIIEETATSYETSAVPDEAWSSRRIEPGDLVRLRTGEQGEELQVFEVDQEGRLYLTEDVAIKAAGLTSYELQEQVMVKLVEVFLQDLEVDILPAAGE